MMADSGDI
jgi:serine/threonine-protein phosphatase 2B catalytic subunit